MSTSFDFGSAELPEDANRQSEVAVWEFGGRRVRVECNPWIAPINDCQFAFFSDALEKINTLPGEDFYTYGLIVRGINWYFGRYWSGMPTTAGRDDDEQ